MKFSGYILCLGIAAAAGCSDSEPEIPKPAAPAAAPAVEAPAPPVAPAVPAPSAAAAPAAAGDVEPELKPIQMAIDTFQAQNKRMPMNVDELVSSGAIQSLPPPPPGKIYYIDHGTKRIKLGGRD